MNRIFRSRMLRACSLIAPAAVVVACGGGSSEPKVPPRDNVPATITSTTTGTLSGQVSAALNTLLSVVVRNKAGQGADSALVTFTVTSGGGSVSNVTVKTDTTGIASTTWTLGPSVGAQTVTATVGTLPPVTFTATATAGPAKNIAKNSTDPQTATSGATVASAPSVKITDAGGNPVPGVAVTFAVASGGGSVTGGTANTDANGIATVGSWRLGTAPGTNTLTATASGIATPVTFTATGTVGAVSTVTFTTTPPASLLIGQTYSAAVTAKDANGNTVASAASFTSSNTGVATVGPTNGVVTAVSGGTTTITATVGGISATQTVTVTGRAGTTVAAALPMSSRIRNVVTAGNSAYAALSTTGSVAAIDIPTSTVVWTTGVGGSVADVAVNSANTRVVTATSTGTAGKLYVIDVATHAVIDSTDLAAPPVRMVMNSTGSRAMVDENSFQLEIVDLTGHPTVTNMVPLTGTVNAMKMAPGDSLFYVGTSLGFVYEVSMNGGAIRRTFTPANTVVDLEISPDGKTLFVADGSNFVFVIPVQTGGLRSQTIDFGPFVNGIGMTPDGQRLWVAQGNAIYAAPLEGTTFNPSLLTGRAQVPGALLSRISFAKNGSAAFVIDEAGNQVIVFK